MSESCPVQWEIDVDPPVTDRDTRIDVHIVWLEFQLGKFQAAYNHARFEGADYNRVKRPDAFVDLDRDLDA